MGAHKALMIEFANEFTPSNIFVTFNEFLKQEHHNLFISKQCLSFRKKCLLFKKIWYYFLLKRSNFVVIYGPNIQAQKSSYGPESQAQA